MTEIQYAPAVGNKFHKDGRVRRFPGNTVICYADPQSAAYQEAAWVQQHLLQQPYADKFAMLPPSSFHMTVFELICDAIRKPEKWSAHLPLDATLEATDRYFIETVPQVTPPSNCRMTFSRMDLGPVGLSLDLEPADDETEKTLRRYRDQLAGVTGLRFPDHETYVFHLSLAYRIIQLTDAEAQQLAQAAEEVNQRLRETFGVFDTGQPTLTFFDDMFAFVPVAERHTLQSRSHQAS